MKTKKTIEGVEISESVKIGDKTYTFARGGLHSVDEPGVFEADETYGIYDTDVGSFYSSIIINHGLVPRHLPKPPFMSGYRNLRDMRLDAKRSGNKLMAASLKIPLNSLFGKTGSAYGWLTDPCALIQCTVRGELTLLLFIDLLHACGAQVVSANTDGCTFMARRDEAAEIIGHLDELAQMLDLSLDWVEYSRFIRRDISNYLAEIAAVRDEHGEWQTLAQDDPGRIKTRGAFRYELDGLERKSVNRIAIKAAQDFFVHGTPIADTVRACRDISMFADFFRPTKSSWHIEDDAGNNLGHIVRWYLGTTGGVGLFAVNPAGKKISKVDAGAVLCNNLPSEFPDNVDFDRYVQMAQENLVSSVLDPPEKHETQIPIAELSKSQRETLTHCQDTSEADIARCEEIDLTWANEMWAKRVKGSRYATAKSIVARLWKGNGGTLTRGDLIWCMQQVDDEGYFTGTQRRTLTGMVGWTVKNISPFKLPQTVEEMVARACTWAVEKVEPCKRKRRMLHDKVTRSTYISGEALRRYGKTKDAYRLACQIAAACVKHLDGEPDQSFIIGLIAEVEQYFSPDEFELETTTNEVL